MGGELKAYTQMLEEARELATQRMIAEAEGMGANAVINVRYEAADCVQGSAEAVIAYGTAVTYA